MIEIKEYTTTHELAEIMGVKLVSIVKKFMELDTLEQV